MSCNDKVGVAFSGLMNSNNIGYIIPLPVVQAFLLQFRTHGACTAKCCNLQPAPCDL